MSTRIIGLDWFEVVVHAAITIAAGVSVDALFHGPVGDVGVAAVIAGSLALLAWRRRRAQAGSADPGSARLAELEGRLADMEAAVGRVYELEERLDFTERLLTQVREREAARLPGGTA
jgi:membrane protein implicated in regulation of membrane protease activity